MTWEIDYLALAPEIIIVVTMLGVVGLDLFLPRPAIRWCRCSTGRTSSTTSPG
jgi:hypothetical protein